MSAKKCFYAVYNDKEELVMVGSSEECAKFMGKTLSGFWCHVSRLANGNIKMKRGEYQAYKIDEDEDEDDLEQ